MPKVYATLTSKGQLTVPREVRAAWNLKAGDQIGFTVTGPTKGSIEPRRRRSIFEGLDELSHDIGRPVSPAEIEAALDEALDEKLLRARRSS